MIPDLRAGIATGRAAWPMVRLTDAAFASRMAALFARDPSIAERFDHVHAADLFLAFACLEGDPAALAAFDATYLRRVPSYVRRYLPDDAAVADVVQELAQRMLGFAGDEVPKLSLYSGLGPLGAFVRVAAVRLAQTSRRSSSRRREDEIGERLVDATRDPELLVLRKQYATQLGEAMRAAVSGLEADDLDLLRLHYYDGMTLEELAATRSVSRATLARRLAAVRERVAAQAAVYLQQTLGAKAPDAASLFGLVRSRLDLGLSQVLGKSRG